MNVRVLVIIGLVLAVGIILVVLISHHNSIREFELNNTPDQLKEIIGNCDCQAEPERTCPQPFIDWQNSTHYIDNNVCEWQKRK